MAIKHLALEQLKELLAEYRLNEVTWIMVEDGQADVNEYRRYQYKMRKVEDLIRPLEMKIINDQQRAERKFRLDRAKNPRYQRWADDLHDLLCKYNHTDQCDYNYGDWLTGDIRNCMLDYYDLVVDMIGRQGEVNLQCTIMTLKQAREMEAVLRKAKDELTGW